MNDATSQQDKSYDVNDSEIDKRDYCRYFIISIGDSDNWS